MSLLRLALLSLLNRKATVILTVLSIAFSVALLLGVQKVQTAAKASFSNTISGTDLIVGARSGDIQLLLYSVFRIGDATNNMTWESYQDIASRPEVAWAVPLSLGDSHRGYRVVGTTAEFFERYSYRRDRSLEFAQGVPFDDLFDAVIGAEVPPLTVRFMSASRPLKRSMWTGPAGQRSRASIFLKRASGR